MDLKAENDLFTATHILKLGDDCPTDNVCFHAQQCVEKYLKDFLVFKGIDFSKTHDIEQLVSLLPSKVGLGAKPEELAMLTDYAVAGRYPGGE